MSPVMNTLVFEDFKPGPLGRYGPRRVEPTLLAVAGTGALFFALADGVPGLLAARALIGAGSGVCLMAPLTAIAAWYPSEKRASLGGWMMVAGGGGALIATPRGTTS